MDKFCLSHSFIPTLEKEDNYLSLPVLDLGKRLNRLNFLNKKIHAHKCFEYMMLFKEIVLDRFYEYFFGYYRNFAGQLFGLFINFKKIRYIIRDFKNYKKR